MGSEENKIKRLFTKLCDQPRKKFPAKGEKLEAPTQHGVYIISKGNAVCHVGRTARAKNGLHQRLTAHLRGRSSFTLAFFNRDGDQLRNGYSFKSLEVPDARERALLEAYATGCLCPKHIGTGEERTPK